MQLILIFILNWDYIIIFFRSESTISLTNIMEISRLCWDRVFLNLWLQFSVVCLQPCAVPSYRAIILTQDAPTLSEYEAVSWEHIFNFVRLRNRVREMVNSEKAFEKYNFQNHTVTVAYSNEMLTAYSVTSNSTPNKQNETASCQFFQFAWSCLKMCAETIWDYFW